MWAALLRGQGLEATRKTPPARPTYAWIRLVQLSQSIFAYINRAFRPFSISNL